MTLRRCPEYLTTQFHCLNRPRAPRHGGGSSRRLRTLQACCGAAASESTSAAYRGWEGIFWQGKFSGGGNWFSDWCRNSPLEIFAQSGPRLAPWVGG